MSEETLTPSSIEAYAQEMLGLDMHRLVPVIRERLSQRAEESPLKVAKETIQQIFVGRTMRLLGESSISPFNPYDGTEIRDMSDAAELMRQKIFVTCLQLREQPIPDARDIEATGTIPMLETAIAEVLEKFDVQRQDLPTPSSPCPALLKMIHEKRTVDHLIEKLGVKGPTYRVLFEAGEISQQDLEDLVLAKNLLASL